MHGGVHVHGMGQDSAHVCMSIRTYIRCMSACIHEGSQTRAYAPVQAARWKLNPVRACRVCVPKNGFRSIMGLYIHARQIRAYISDKIASTIHGRLSVQL